VIQGLFRRGIKRRPSLDCRAHSSWCFFLEGDTALAGNVPSPVRSFADHSTVLPPESAFPLSTLSQSLFSLLYVPPPSVVAFGSSLGQSDAPPLLDFSLALSRFSPAQCTLCQLFSLESSFPNSFSILSGSQLET